MEVAGTVHVGGKDVEFTREPVPEDLVGVPRQIYQPSGGLTIYACPDCGADSLKYNFLCYRPALAWACTACGYSEHPPIRHVSDNTYPEMVEADWEILRFPKEWVTDYAVVGAP